MKRDPLSLWILGKTSSCCPSPSWHSQQLPLPPLHTICFESLRSHLTCSLLSWYQFPEKEIWAQVVHLKSSVNITSLGKGAGKTEDCGPGSAVAEDCTDSATLGRALKLSRSFWMSEEVVQGARHSDFCVDQSQEELGWAHEGCDMGKRVLFILWQFLEGYSVKSCQHQHPSS